MKQFNAKTFNEEAFGRYMNAIPDVKRNKLLESGAITGNAELKNLFANQTGSFYGTIPFYGNLDQSEPDNYDGSTNISADTTVTYTQGVFVYGRAKGWTEKDFSYDITGGVDFMANVRDKLLKYWYNVDQDTLLAILKGIFSMTGKGNIDFVNNHTNNIAQLPSDADAKVNATTLNSTTQKACGDNKGIFSLAVMHSQVSTNLENMNLIERLKYTDEKGIQRDLELYTWNGRLVIVDDSMPTAVVEAKYVRCDKGTKGAKVVKDSGASGENEVNKSDVTGDISDIAAGEYVYLLPQHTEYTTYVLGNGSINLEDIGAKVPYEMARDPKTNGGEDTLYTRKRKAVAVPGFSWTNKSVASLSPTKKEIEDPQNWELINDGHSSNKKYYDHKAIAIARIISRG
jgi:hypothetical protein